MSARSTPLVRTCRWGLAALAVAVAGCSSTDAAGAAVGLIEGALSDQLGLGPLAADCDEPSASAAGEEFTCTGTTEDGAVIDFTAVFDADDEVFVYPTNIVVDSSLFEAEGAETLGPEFGLEIDPAQIECPEEITVLDPAGRMFCTITDATTGGVFPMTVTLGGYIRDEGFDQRLYEVGEQIE
jgi:hypothetical protein